MASGVSGVQYYTCAGMPQTILEDFCGDQQSPQTLQDSEMFDLTAACCCPPVSRQSMDDSMMYQMNEPMYPCRPYSADNICYTLKKNKLKRKRKNKCKCCKQVKKVEKEQTPEYYHANIPWSGLPTTYDPCVHLHFKTKTIDRCDLTQQEYMDLLATPKGYRWVGMCNPYKKRGYCKQRKPKRCRKVKKQRRPQFYCTSSIPEDRLMRTLMGELCGVMSPEMMDRLRDILVCKFGLSKEDAGDYISCDQYKKGKKRITTKECTTPRIGAHHKWVRDLSKMLAEKLIDYILVTLAMKRTPRTNRIAEIILEHLCDLTGIKTTISTAKTEMEVLLVLTSDRLAIWVEGIIRDILKKKIKHKKTPPTPFTVQKESKTETAESRPETRESSISEEKEESAEEMKLEEEEVSEEEEKVEEEEKAEEEEETNEEDIKEEEEETMDKEEEEIVENEGEGQIEEEPEDEEDYEAVSEEEAEDMEVEMEEFEGPEVEFEEENETEAEDETEDVEDVEEEEEPEKPVVEEKPITPAVLPPLITAGRVFEIKAGPECHYEIKQLSSTTVAHKVAAAKGKEPPTIRKVPKTESLLNTESLKEWAMWAKEVAGTAEQWGHWLDKTIIDVEKRAILLKHQAEEDPSKAESYNKEYNQWLNKQLDAYRGEKKRITQDLIQWNNKIEKKIKQDNNPEVETNVHDL